MNGVVVRAAQGCRPRCPSDTETELDEQDEGSEGRSCQSQQRFPALLAAPLHLRPLRYHTVWSVACFFMSLFLCLIETDWLHYFTQQQSDICLSCCTEKMDYICANFSGAKNFFVKLVSLSLIKELKGPISSFHVIENVIFWTEKQKQGLILINRWCVSFIIGQHQ